MDENVHYWDLTALNLMYNYEENVMYFLIKLYCIIKIIVFPMIIRSTLISHHDIRSKMMYQRMHKNSRHRYTKFYKIFLQGILHV